MSLPPRLHGRRRIRTRHTPIDRSVSLFAQEALYREEVSGIVLMISTVVAIVVSNSPWREAVEGIWTTAISIDLGILAVREDLRHWINDFLMAIFFLQVGLEIKQELLEGELARWKNAALPLAMAIGGMVAPAAIFLAFTAGTEHARGWPIPMATDIAFALGTIALLGKRISGEARILLLGMAIVDDIASIAVIAAVYTKDIDWGAVAATAIPVAFIVVMRLLKAQSLSVYLFAGLFLWFAVLRSGFHPTLAGVLLASLIPSSRILQIDAYAKLVTERVRVLRETGSDDEQEAIVGEIGELTDETETPLERLSGQLTPWVSYFVLPLFALANAGVVLKSLSLETLVAPVALGIAGALVIGKPAGMLAATWLATRLGVARMPKNVSWKEMTGLAMLSGIGFTVSLFIAGLTYEGEALLSAKAAVLAASAAMAVAGYVYLRSIR